MRRRTVRWLAAGLVLGHAALWLACGGVDGERARSGECPPGEVCSPNVDGLTFHGGATYDALLPSALLPIAVGGTQRLSFSQSWFGAVNGRGVSSDPRVLAIEESGPGEVTVRAVGVGRAHLRIVDDSDRLLDRVELASAEVVRVELRGSSRGYSSWAGPWAFRRGGTALVLYVPIDADGQRLIDESARPSEGPGVAAVSWDAAEVDLDRTGDELTLGLELGGHLRLGTAPVVDTVDRIEPTSWDREALVRARTVEVGRDAIFCFLAFAGDLPVAGVRFEVSAVGPVTAEGVRDTAVNGPLCARVHGEAVGEAELVVRADGVEARRALRVIE